MARHFAPDSLSHVCLHMWLQMIEFCLKNNANINDVDFNNVPIFTNDAKRDWLLSKQSELRKSMENPFEKPYLDPVFEVHLCAGGGGVIWTWVVCNDDCCFSPPHPSHALAHL